MFYDELEPASILSNLHETCNLDEKSLQPKDDLQLSCCIKIWKLSCLLATYSCLNSGLVPDNWKFTNTVTIHDIVANSKLSLVCLVPSSKSI